LGISQYLATAANAFDHAVKRRVLAIDWIVRLYDIQNRDQLAGAVLSTSTDSAMLLRACK
jgi:hypothetical protein